jgi:hypothetical protein
MSAEYGPLSLVAALAKVSTGTVRNWRYRGWLNPSGERRYVRVQGRDYHFGDVLAAERDTYLSVNSHRERDLAA